MMLAYLSFANYLQIPLLLTALNLSKNSILRCPYTYPIKYASKNRRTEWMKLATQSKKQVSPLNNLEAESGSKCYISLFYF